MRIPMVGLAIALAVAAAPMARAEPPSATSAAQRNPAGVPSRALFERLDLHLVARARAAECKDEGETCKTSAECCSGLECSGAPQPTCRPPE